MMTHTCAWSIRRCHMKRRPLAHLRILLTLAGLALLGSMPWALAAGTRLDTATIEQLTGVKGELNEKEAVFKVSVPRTDLDVRIAGVKMTPPLGLTSWAAFLKAGDQTMVMG